MALAVSIATFAFPDTPDQTVLDQIDFSVSAGERLAILGPSGSGKTTLLKIIAGLIQTHRGSVMVDGRPTDRLRQDGRISFVFQASLILPWLSVLDNILLPCRLLNVPYSSERFATIVSSLEIENVLDLQTSVLSGGMIARVAIARALITDPELLLIDETLSALDEPLRYAIWKSVSIVSDRSIVLFVTHNAFDAVAFGTGDIVLSRSPAAITHKGTWSGVPISYPPILTQGQAENVVAIQKSLARSSH